MIKLTRLQKLKLRFMAIFCLFEFNMKCAFLKLVYMYMKQHWLKRIYTKFNTT